MLWPLAAPLALPSSVYVLPERDRLINTTGRSAASTAAPVSSMPAPHTCVLHTQGASWVLPAAGIVQACVVPSSSLVVNARADALMRAISSAGVKCRIGGLHQSGGRGGHR